MVDAPLSPPAARSGAGTAVAAVSAFPRWRSDRRRRWPAIISLRMNGAAVSAMASAAPRSSAKPNGGRSGLGSLAQTPGAEPDRCDLKAEPGNLTPKRRGPPRLGHGSRPQRRLARHQPAVKTPAREDQRQQENESEW